MDFVTLFSEYFKLVQSIAKNLKKNTAHSIPC